jgi:HCOMODA/2-hydroxy-3-carboxy-muconic semialdehyde decarboxylase
MKQATGELREEIVCAARAFARLGYVHAFGHVSARMDAGLLITPTRPPLARQCAADILQADVNGHVIEGAVDARPIEIFLHLGIYRTRPDVNAICRTHAPAASLWRGGRVPPVQHGFGGIAASVATYGGVDLIHEAALGAAAAAALGAAQALILRGNGVLAVGANIPEAAARMWSLEERCAVALREGAQAAAFSAEEMQARQRWYAAEQKRVWMWLRELGQSPAGARMAARSLRQSSRSA